MGRTEREAYRRHRNCLPRGAMGKTPEERQEFARGQKERLIILGLSVEQAEMVIHFVGPTRALSAGRFVINAISPERAHFGNLGCLLASLLETRPSVNATVNLLSGCFGIYLPEDCPPRAAHRYIRALYEIALDICEQQFEPTPIEL